jgi:hypothetical protein
VPLKSTLIMQVSTRASRFCGLSLLLWNTRTFIPETSMLNGVSGAGNIASADAKASNRYPRWHPR